MRKDYTLSEDEFARLSPIPVPDDYEPGWREMAYPGRGVHLFATRHTVPAIQFDSAAVWQEAADRLGFRLLSVRWPDPAFPDFTAEPI